MSTAYLNGEFAELERVHISPLDRGFMFGDGVYEVVPIYDANPFRLEDHLERLQRSLDAIRLRNPHSQSEWAALLEELVRRNNLGDQLVYLQVTRGVAPREHGFPTGVPATVFVSSKPWSRPGEFLTAGAITRPDNRWQRCDIKSIALLANVLLRQEALDGGASECIVTRDGFVTEGAASNVFVVRDGRIETPPSGLQILSGITRACILRLAEKAGLDCREVPIPVSSLREADEIWLTSSSMELRWVTELDGQAVSDGAIGSTGKTVLALFRESISASTKRGTASS